MDGFLDLAGEFRNSDERLGFNFEVRHLGKHPISSSHLWIHLVGNCQPKNMVPATALGFSPDPPKISRAGTPRPSSLPGADARSMWWRTTAPHLAPGSSGPWRPWRGFLSGPWSLGFLQLKGGMSQNGNSCARKPDKPVTRISEILECPNFCYSFWTNWTNPGFFFHILNVSQTNFLGIPIRLLVFQEVSPWMFVSDLKSFPKRSIVQNPKHGDDFVFYFFMP